MGCSAPAEVWDADTPIPDVAAQPLQARMDPTLLPSPHPDWVVTAVAQYAIAARVVGVKRYRWDAMAPVSALDFALAWGPASTDDVQDALIISQGRRWYRFRAKERTPPLPFKVLNDNMANVHLVPASDEAASALSAVRKGDRVAMLGYLVNLTDGTGREHKTSLTRTDSGAGACEIMYVLHVVRLT